MYSKIDTLIHSIYLPNDNINIRNQLHLGYVNLIFVCQNYSQMIHDLIKIFKMCIIENFVFDESKILNKILSNYYDNDSIYTKYHSYIQEQFIFSTYNQDYIDGNFTNSDFFKNGKSDFDSNIILIDHIIVLFCQLYKAKKEGNTSIVNSKKTDIELRFSELFHSDYSSLPNN